jgi:cob(I)alamin adenosyltransferase
MAPFYTRSGDDGYTGLLGEGRIKKYDPRIEALGDLDETSAALGLAKAFASSDITRSILGEIQRDLYLMMTEVAAAPGNASKFRRLDQARVDWLESLIKDIEQQVSIPTEFILPGDTQAGAFCDLVRAVSRRAERRVVSLYHQKTIDNPELQKYLNRLSSLCFLLELLENQQTGKTTLAKPS